MNFGFEAFSGESKQSAAQPYVSGMGARPFLSSRDWQDLTDILNNYQRGAVFGLKDLISLVSSAAKNEEDRAFFDEILEHVEAVLESKKNEIATTAGFGDDLSGNGLLSGLWHRFLEWLISHNGYHDYYDGAFASLDTPRGIYGGVDTSHQREASLLNAMAKGDLEEQKKISAELDKISRERVAKWESEREIDFGGAVVEDRFSPVVSVAGAVHTSATDWLAEVGEPQSNAEIQRAMTSAASAFYLQASDLAKSDYEEYKTQAEGAAHLAASAHAPLVAEAKSMFMDHALFLNRSASHPQPNKGLPNTASFRVQSAGLYDADTAEYLGEATPEQVAASEAEGETGIFLIDVDGDPVFAGEFGSQNARRVYVQASKLGSTDPVSDIPLATGLPVGVPVDGYRGDGISDETGAFDNFAPAVAPENQAAVAEEGTSESTPSLDDLNSDAVTAGFRSVDVPMRGFISATQAQKSASFSKLAKAPITGIAIYPDKTVEEVTITGLKDYQDIVKGWIEPVGLSDGSTMYVNEEYSYAFTHDDVNWVASDVASLGGRQDFLLRPILGPVVVVGPVNSDGDSTSITDKARRWVTRVSREASLNPSRKTAYDTAKSGAPWMAAEGEERRASAPGSHHHGSSHTYEIKTPTMKDWEPVFSENYDDIVEAARGIISPYYPSSFVWVKNLFDGSVTVFELAPSAPRGNAVSVMSYERFYGTPYPGNRYGSSTSRRAIGSDSQSGPRPLYEIAREIRRDWKNVYFGAVPYLDAMGMMDDMSSNFGADSPSSIVAYFLSNATGWRGETARRVKAELKKMLKSSTSSSGRFASHGSKLGSISLTNIGIEDRDAGICFGRDSAGNKVRFRATREEIDQLRNVMLSDLAMNFSGVSIDESDIVSTGSRKTGAVISASTRRDETGKWSCSVVVSSRDGSDAAGLAEATEAAREVFYEDFGDGVPADVSLVGQSSQGGMNSYVFESSFGTTSSLTSSGGYMWPEDTPWVVVSTYETEGGKWGCSVSYGDADGGSSDVHDVGSATEVAFNAFRKEFGVNNRGGVRFVGTSGDRWDFEYLFEEA